MKNRNYEIKVRLTQAEMIHLTRLVSASGLSRETYLRKLISGVVPREAPPPDFFSMMRELHYIGNNLNQIAMKAHALNAIDAKHYDDGVRLFEDAVQKILSASLRRTLQGIWPVHDSESQRPGQNLQRMGSRKRWKAHPAQHYPLRH